MVARNYYTPKELAEEYGFNLSTIIRWCQTGKLRAYQPGGFRSDWRIPRDAWQELLDAQEVRLAASQPVKLHRRKRRPRGQAQADAILDGKGV